MKEKRTKKKRSNPVPPEIEAEINALAASKRRIRTDLIPEVRNWRGARRGLFFRPENFRPIKKQLTLRIDADVIDWFKTHAPKGQGYQTSMNSALRDFVERQADDTPS